MKKTLIVLLVFVLVAGLLFTGCGQTATTESQSADASQSSEGGVSEAAESADSSEATGETIKIGALLDYTGVCAELGPKFEAGIRLALEEANYQVAGHPVELVTADSGSDATKAVEQFKNITEKEGVKLIVGPLMGDAHLAIAPLAKEKDVIITSLVDGMYDAIETSGEHYVIYPTTCEAQTYSFGKYAFETLGYKTMVTVTANMAGKLAFTEGIKQGFEDAGGTIVQEITTEVGTDDYSSFISTLEDADCVMYALNGPAEVSKFIYQYEQAGKEMPLLTITQDADYTPEALAELGDVALNILGEASYTWQLDNAQNAEFVAGIEAATGNLPSSSEQNSYTLTKALLAALEQTGGDDSYAVMWPAIISLDMQTPAGQLTFESEGVAITDMYITEAEKSEDGTIQLSAPIDTVPQIRDQRLVEAAGDNS